MNARIRTEFGERGELGFPDDLRRKAQVGSDSRDHMVLFLCSHRCPPLIFWRVWLHLWRELKSWTPGAAPSKRLLGYSRHQLGDLFW